MPTIPIENPYQSNKLPGEDFAKSLGYQLQYHSGNRLSACYVKHFEEDPEHPLFLEISKDPNKGELSGKLTKILGMVSCVLGPFSIPNKSYDCFEKQVRGITQWEIKQTVLPANTEED